MKNKQKYMEILINIACVAALIVVLIPLLLLAKYNYPSADDWSYGAYTYKVVKNGGNLVEIMQAASGKALQTYLNVEGRFVGAFLATLQPGIWGEKYYVIVPWLLLGMIVFSAAYFVKYFLCKGGKIENRRMWIPVVVPSLIMQILYCPYPVESFYWYTGSMNYTFSYCLSLILLVLFIKMATAEVVEGKYVITAIVAGMLAIAVGGMNFGTSLSSFLVLCVLTVLYFVYDKRAVGRTLHVTLLLGASLMLCIFAPGNANRISSNFGGETGSPIDAVIMSLVRSVTNMYSWTNIKVILMIAFIAPFVWKSVKNVDWKFRFPGIFTVLTFGLYASQSAPTMYVDGTTGGGRMAAILYYSYHLWVLANVYYWTGWLYRVRSKCPKALKKSMGTVYSAVQRFLLPYCAVVGVILVSVIYLQDLKEISSYKAYRDYRQGWAQQYAKEWDERIAILKDESVTQVEFAPLSVYPEMILYTDLQDKDGHIWVNIDCARYYDKESIIVVDPADAKTE